MPVGRMATLYTRISSSVIAYAALLVLAALLLVAGRNQLRWRKTHS